MTRFPPLIEEPTWRLELSLKLQRSLRIDGVMQQFVTHLSQAIPFDSAHLVDIETRWYSSQSARQHRQIYPIRQSDRCLGYIIFTRTTAFNSIESNGLRHVLTDLTHPLKNAMRFERAFSASRYDALTGLGNRSGFEHALEGEILRAHRNDEPLSLIMLDVDHFKQFNDRYGHLAGDRILEWLSQHIRACIHHNDQVFRYGGEEFVILLDQTPLDKACLLAARIRNRIGSRPALIKGPSILNQENSRKLCIPITVSLGIAQLTKDDVPRALLARADKALYAAKSQGRNGWQALVTISPTDTAN